VASALVREWRAFKDDQPGDRFENHHDRMRREGTRAGAIARVVLGVVLTLGGIALLFIPGPGLLVILFGMGLLGGQSKTLARALDRVEPPVRRGARRLVRAFKRRSRATQVMIVAIAALIAAAAAYGLYRWWFA